MEMPYGVEAVVDEMLEVFTHADLSHQLVLVAVHARQLAYVCKHVLQAVGQLQEEAHASSSNKIVTSRYVYFFNENN